MGDSSVVGQQLEMSAPNPTQESRNLSMTTSFKLSVTALAISIVTAGFTAGWISSMPSNTQAPTTQMPKVHVPKMEMPEVKYAPENGIHV